MKSCVTYLLGVVLVFKGAALGANASLPAQASLSENAALYYYQAFAANSGAADIETRSAYEPTYAIWNLPINKQIIRDLQASQQAFVLLHFAGKMPYCQWGDAAADRRWGTATPTTAEQRSRELMDVAVLEVRLEWRKRHWNKASQIINDMLILAHRIGQEKEIVGPLVSWSMDNIIFEAIAAHIGALPDAGLRPLQMVLGKMPRFENPAAALRGSSQMAHSFMRQALREKNQTMIHQIWQQTWKAQFYKDPAWQTKVPPAAPMPVGFPAELRAAIPVLERRDRSIAVACGEPYPQVINSLKALNQRAVKWQTRGSFMLREYAQSKPGWIWIIHAQAVVGRANCRAAIAYRLGGRSAFDKIRDPFGPGPLILEKQANQLVIRSRLDIAALVTAKESRQITSMRVPLAPRPR